MAAARVNMVGAMMTAGSVMMSMVPVVATRTGMPTMSAMTAASAAVVTFCHKLRLNIGRHGHGGFRCAGSSKKQSRRHHDNRCDFVFHGLYYEENLSLQL